MEEIALSIHFFRREEFQGITRSGIETEVAHFNSNCCEVLPVLVGRGVGDLHETGAVLER